MFPYCNCIPFNAYKKKSEKETLMNTHTLHNKRTQTKKHTHKLLRSVKLHVYSTI